MSEWEKYLRQYEVDLYISQQHFSPINPALQMIFFKLSGLKAGMEFHSDITVHASRFPNTPMMYRTADFLVTLSKTFKNYWANFGIRSYYTPHSVYIDDVENFHGRNAKKVSNTILYVGRIAHEKNTLAVLPIIKEVAKVIPDVKLQIVGEVYHKDVFDYMKKFLSENNLENNVEFFGYSPKVRTFYESADIMLNTSLAEGWSLVIAESKFYELPLVLYELPDSELLSDGKGYISVQPGDFKAAARSIIKILTDTEFRCKLSAEARESIQPFLDYDIAGAWQKIFDDLDNNAPIPQHSTENEKIQTLFVKEVWKQKMSVQNLAAQIKQLKS